MASFIQLGPKYFQTYLEKLPQNAETQKKFSYNPWMSNCPDISIKNFCGLVRFVLSYPFARLHDFWKERQVSQNIAHARQQAVDTLKLETQFDLPIKILAVLALAIKLAPDAQAQEIAELEEAGDHDLARSERDSPRPYVNPLHVLQEATDEDYAAAIDEIAGSLSQDATDTLFLEMATQRLPARLYAEAHKNLAIERDVIGCKLIEQKNEDEIDIENRQITINRTATIERNGEELGTLRIQAFFDCREQSGKKRFIVTFQ